MIAQQLDLFSGVDPAPEPKPKRKRQPRTKEIKHYCKCGKTKTAYVPMEIWCACGRMMEKEE